MSENQKRIIKSIYLEIATRRDVKELEPKIEARFESIRGELTLIKWMVGLLLGGVAALILKAFF